VSEPTQERSLRSLRIKSVVERKHTTLPRFVVVPASSVSAWSLQGTTVVEVRVNDVEVGRRSLKHWGPDRDCWFFDLTETHCRQADVETGTAVLVELRRADQTPPEELTLVIGSDPSALLAWESLSPSRQRQLSEHVRAGKRAETRARRARSALVAEG
jgi:hypothetical protein